MKKSILICLLAVIFFGCKPKQTVVGTKLDNKSEVAIKGNWTLISVIYPGSEFIKVTSFDIADSKCFVGSNWKFISNNNKGEFILNQSSCTAFSSPITWFVNEEGQFILKILSSGEKAKKVRDGFILTVANQSESRFQLIDKVNVGGNIIEVVYQFQKNN
jgi:hypothetical protein